MTKEQRAYLQAELKKIKAELVKEFKGEAKPKFVEVPKLSKTINRVDIEGLIKDYIETHTSLAVRSADDYKKAQHLDKVIVLQQLRGALNDL